MIKPLLKSIFAIVMIALVISSCKKDEDIKEVEKKSQIVSNGAEYELSKGYLEYYGHPFEGLNGSTFILYLLSSGVIHDTIPYSFTGNGNGVYLMFFSSSSTDLKPGTYYYDPFSGSMDSFARGSVRLNYDFNTNTEAESEIVSGNVNIAKSGNIYEISANYSADAIISTIYYKGTLEYHDYSVFTKSTAPNPLGFDR